MTTRWISCCGLGEVEREKTPPAAKLRQLILTFIHMILDEARP
jgi:hypothetical protein